MCFYVISNVREKSLSQCYKISPFGRGKRGTTRLRMTATYKTLKVPWLSFSGNQETFYKLHQSTIQFPETQSFAKTSPGTINRMNSTNKVYRMSSS